MSLLRTPFDDPHANPLDVIEQIVCDNGWPLERHGDQEISTTVNGGWCDYQLCFSWREQPNVLQFSCAFQFDVPDAGRPRLSLLLALVNERMWLGHFDLWSEKGAVMFHYALLLGGSVATSEQFERMVEIGLAECERFYPAFGMVISGAASAEKAIVAALLDTVGEA